MDGALQESEITAAKQHHMMLLKKKKAERKNNADAAFNEWTRIVTLDSIVLSADCESIDTIDSKPLESWNMKHLRALCSKFKISGYKNRRRDEMVSLLWERKKNEFVERDQYDDENVGDKSPLHDTRLHVDADNSQLYSDSSEDDSKMPAASSPVTRSTTAKAAASLANETTNKKRRGKNLLLAIEPSPSSKKPKTCNKSTVPSSVTIDGTYYRAINVWFDERNRVDIVNMGSSPTIRELDARKKFANKPTYDKLLLTYLDNSAENIAINYIGFDNEYLNDCGITDQYASEFDILTSEDLCNVLEYVVYWYNVAFRNNKTSGT